MLPHWRTGLPWLWPLALPRRHSSAYDMQTLLLTVMHNPACLAAIVIEWLSSPHEQVGQDHSQYLKSDNPTALLITRRGIFLQPEQGLAGKTPCGQQSQNLLLLFTLMGWLWGEKKDDHWFIRSCIYPARTKCLYVPRSEKRRLRRNRSEESGKLPAWCACPLKWDQWFSAQMHSQPPGQPLMNTYT